MSDKTITIEIREYKTNDVLEKFPLTEWRVAGREVSGRNQARWQAYGWESLGVLAVATDGERERDVSDLVKTRGVRLPMAPHAFWAFCDGYYREVEDDTRDGLRCPIDAGWAEVRRRAAEAADEE